MDVIERPIRGPSPKIHWLVRGVMWLLVALCVALPSFMLVAPLFLHPVTSAPGTAWTALSTAGSICGVCVLGAGFLGTLAWRGDPAIRGVVWNGHRVIGPHLPWYTRAWAGIVCAGMLMLGAAQAHRAVSGDASWLSTLMTIVMVVVAVRYVWSPFLVGRWSEATIRFAPRLAMTPREIHAAATAEHGRRHDT